MKKLSISSLAVVFAAGALTAGLTHAAEYESGDRGVKAPSSGGDDAQKGEPKGKAGVSTMPSKNKPASVSESAPDKTGKEVSGVSKESKGPNPKTPASPNESGPASSK